MEPPPILASPTRQQTQGNKIMVRLSQALFDVIFVLYSFIIMCYIINLNDRTRQPGLFLLLPLTLKINDFIPPSHSMSANALPQILHCV